jgi:hypothetical protein
MGAMTDAPRAPRRVLLHLEPGLRVPVEPDEVFLLEADGDETRVRTRGCRRLRDIRSLGEVLARFPSGLLVQVHRSAAVNVDRVTEVRRAGERPRLGAAPGAAREQRGSHRPHPAGGTVGGLRRSGALTGGIPVSSPPPA